MPFDLPVLIPCAAVALVVVIPAVFVLATYNRLVGLRNRIRESWSGIDTELKRRHDLIPNLVETVKGYAAHEQRTLEGVIAMRSDARAALDNPEPDNVADKERRLTGSMARLIALAEQYPVLKADDHFRRLMHELALTEDRIQAARRFYNANVRDMNNLVQMFPSSLIAQMFGFSTAKFFELDSAAERFNPAVNI